MTIDQLNQISMQRDINLLKKKVMALEKLNTTLLEQHELRVSIGQGAELPPWAVNLISGREDES